MLIFTVYRSHQILHYTNTEERRTPLYIARVAASLIVAKVGGIRREAIKFTEALGSRHVSVELKSSRTTAAADNVLGPGPARRPSTHIYRLALDQPGLPNPHFYRQALG